jgi:hypothetical protein
LMQQVTDDDPYVWLNDRACAIDGEVRPRDGGSGFDVSLDVSMMTWEPLVACSATTPVTA